MATQVATIPAKPFFLQALADDPAIDYTASEFRRILAAIWNRNGAINAKAMYVFQGDTVGWRIKVNQGFCYFGTYLVYLPAAITIELSTFDTSPSSTRAHRVYVAVYDKQLTGNEYAAKLVVTEDTGAGAGVPSGAAAYMLLATASISPNQTSIRSEHIVDRRAHASAGSGYVQLSPASGMDDVRTANPALGTAALRIDYSWGICRFSGALSPTSGTFSGSGSPYLLTTLPEEYWPNTQKWLAAMTAGALPWLCHIDGSGRVYAIFNTNVSSASVVHLDGITYEVD